jgi:hypothetical protein
MSLNDLCNAITALVTSAQRVEVDSVGVRRFAGDGLVESVDWSHLVAVSARTTDDGPFADDHFWVLVGDDGRGCVVSSERASGVDLLGVLGRLPRFDFEQVIASSACVEEATFPLWSGTGEEAALAMRELPARVAG